MDEARLTEQGKLVARLREQAAAVGRHHRDDRDTWGRAADEIERLAAIIVCERIETQALRAQLVEAQADRERLRERGVSFVRYCLDRAFQKVSQEHRHRAPHQDRRWWREIRSEAIEAAKTHVLRSAIDAAREES